jgi:hypothetical protein
MHVFQYAFFFFEKLNHPTKLPGVGGFLDGSTHLLTDPKRSSERVLLNLVRSLTYSNGGQQIDGLRQVRGAVGGLTNNLRKGKWEENGAFDIQSMNTVDMILANMKKVRMALDH